MPDSDVGCHINGIGTVEMFVCLVSGRVCFGDYSWHCALDLTITIAVAYRDL